MFIKYICDVKFWGFVLRLLIFLVIWLLYMIFFFEKVDLEFLIVRDSENVDRNKM